MLAMRLRTLSIFAGGCLSGAVLIVLWRSDARSVPHDTTPAPSAATERELPAVDERAPQHEADPHPSADDARHDTEGVEHTLAKHAPPAPKAPEEPVEASSAESGAAVSDVLAHLEAAYREQLAALPASNVPASATAAHAEPSPSAAVTSPTPPPANALVAVASAPAVPARAELPVASAAATPAPVAAAPAALAPITAAPAALAPNAAAPVAPTQNVNIGSIHQGDTYHVQQVAIMQYLPVFAPWPYSGYGYPLTGAGARAPRQPQRVPYPTTLTNPDNPWGYEFPSALWTVR